MADSEPNPVDAQDLLWEAERARRALLSHLGITPLVSRSDPVGAKPAQRFDQIVDNLKRNEEKVFYTGKILRINFWIRSISRYYWSTFENYTQGFHI